jgi:hypothetical protein
MASEQRIQAMLRAFEQAYAAAVPFREDGALGADLTTEVRPVLEALADIQGADGEPRHEAYALLTLLGRRAGVLGATPSAALGLLAALLEGLASVGHRVAPGERDQLAMVLLEGYCVGRDERVTRGLKRANTDGQVWLRLAPRCYAGFLAGAVEADAAEQVLDAWARALLQHDARSCVLDVTRVQADHPEPPARPVVSFCHTAFSLGVGVHLVRPHPELFSALVEVGLYESRATVFDSFEAALAAGMRAVGYALSGRRRGWDWLTAFLGPSRKGG